MRLITHHQFLNRNDWVNKRPYLLLLYALVQWSLTSFLLLHKHLMITYSLKEEFIFWDDQRALRFGYRQQLFICCFWFSFVNRLVLFWRDLGLFVLWIISSSVVVCLPTPRLLGALQGWLPEQPFPCSLPWSWCSPGCRLAALTVAREILLEEPAITSVFSCFRSYDSHLLRPSALHCEVMLWVAVMTKECSWMLFYFSYHVNFVLKPQKMRLSSFSETTWFSFWKIWVLGTCISTFLAFTNKQPHKLLWLRRWHRTDFSTEIYGWYDGESSRKPSCSACNFLFCEKVVKIITNQWKNICMCTYAHQSFKHCYHFPLQLSASHTLKQETTVLCSLVLFPIIPRACNATSRRLF